MMTSLKKLTLIAFLLAMTLLPIIASCQYATFYADKYEGRKCSKGDIYWHHKMTCASNDYPNGTILRVTHNGKSIDVRVNDRMHHSIHGVIDLSKEAFKMIANTRQGRVKVKIKIIKK